MVFYEELGFICWAGLKKCFHSYWSCKVSDLKIYWDWKYHLPCGTSMTKNRVNFLRPDFGSNDLLFQKCSDIISWMKRKYVVLDVHCYYNTYCHGQTSISCKISPMIFCISPPTSFTMISFQKSTMLKHISNTNKTVSMVLHNCID